MSNKSIFNEICEINSKIEIDFGGGSMLSKTYLMAYLIRSLSLEVYVEIGVYKGRSLFPAAAAVYKNKGRAFGIDPYSVSDAYENEAPTNIQEAVNQFLDATDFEGLYNDVLRYKESVDFGDCVKIIREASQDAVDYFIDKKIAIGMLHIDGNHDSKFVKMDADYYYPLIKEGGIIVFDDIDWESVRGCYEEYKKTCYVLFEADTFGVLIKPGKGMIEEDRIGGLTRKLQILYDKLEKFDQGLLEAANTDYVPTVCVGILTYNHEKYIEQCLDGVFEQTGNFKMKVIIIDDSSQDNTRKIVSNYIKNLGDKDKIEVIFKSNPTNIGVVRNLQQCISYFQGSDYFTFCEGDDYWTDGLRIQKLISFMTNHLELALCFNKMQLYYQDTNKISFYDEQENLKKSIYTTEDIIRSNFIGNFSACFYDSSYLNQIDEKIFNIYVVDWFFNTYYSQFGDIGFYDRALSVYRKHSAGEWSGMEDNDRKNKLVNLIDKYNEILDFVYDKEYTKVRNVVTWTVDGNFIANYDLLLIDGCFPLEKSGFRYVEFTNILQNIDSVKVLTDGSDIKYISTLAMADVIKTYKRKYPSSTGKLQEFSEYSECINFKLVYIVFLNNAFTYVDFAMKKRKPFVFTLYPGGGFAFNNKESDNKLKKVMRAPNFKKVIVTQKPVYDYLINKKFCKEEQIEYIFGVVTDTERLKETNIQKKFYKIGKERLDICFVAFKYTSKGQDKGYDIFVETAKILRKQKDNIFFHVVGNFDESVIDVSDISDRITFYGAKEPSWFDEFYKDKDIILSPNQPDRLFQGAFDGFPTTACIDAGLRKAALFCTDNLKMNDGYFEDGKEIVIISNDARKNADIILHYYNNPKELKAICEGGCEKIKKLYSYETQIQPRIELLKNEIAAPFKYKDPNLFKCIGFRIKVLAYKVFIRVKRITPKPIKVLYKRIRGINV